MLDGIDGNVAVTAERRGVGWHRLVTAELAKATCIDSGERTTVAAVGSDGASDRVSCGVGMRVEATRSDQPSASTLFTDDPSDSIGCKCGVIRRAGEEQRCIRLSRLLAVWGSMWP